jgi:predicted trehalose synthase
MDNTIDALVAQEEEVAAQAYIAGLDDPTMAQALAALTTATTQMKAVAAKMISVTTFISNVASLGTATNNVVSALAGTHGTGEGPKG